MQQQQPLDVLCLYPCVRGYAFVHFQGRSQVADWGRRQTSASHARRNAETMADIQALVESSPPDVIVIEDYSERGSRRSARIRRLYRAIVHMAHSRSIEVERIGRAKMTSAFATVGARSRYEIAQAVAQEFHEFGYRLPKKPRIWDREPQIMALFIAAALGTTFYARSEVS